MVEHFELETLRVVTGIFGAALLVNEVSLAHKVEDIKAKIAGFREYFRSSNMLEIRDLNERLNHIETINDKREFLIRFQSLLIGVESARTMYSMLDDVRVGNLFAEKIREIRGNFQNVQRLENLNSNLEKLEKLSNEKRMKSRKILLWTGFTLICISFLVDFYILTLPAV